MQNKSFNILIHSLNPNFVTNTITASPFKAIDSAQAGAWFARSLRGGTNLYFQGNYVSIFRTFIPRLTSDVRGVGLGQAASTQRNNYLFLLVGPGASATKQSRSSYYQFAHEIFDAATPDWRSRVSVINLTDISSTWLAIRQIIY